MSDSISLSNIRNIGFIAHIEAGKMTLSERVPISRAEHTHSAPLMRAQRMREQELALAGLVCSRGNHV